MQVEAGDVEAPEDQVGAEADVLPGDGDPLQLAVVARCEPAPLVELAVVGQVGLRGDAEDRAAVRNEGTEVTSGSRTLFVGPTSLLVYKAIAVEGGVLFPVYQRDSQARERWRVAVNFAYFFWLQ